MRQPTHRNLFAGLVLAAAAATAAYAQTADAQKDGASTISMTGCLERASEGTAAGGFILNNASQSVTTTPMMGDPRIGSVGSATSSNTTPAKQEPPAPAKPAQYALSGSERDLAPHVNHRVTVVGTWDPAAEPGVTATSGGSAAEAKTVMPRLRVARVRMVADNCNAR